MASSGIELRFCDIRSALDCCCQIALDIVQVVWSPYIGLELQLTYGEDWRGRCEDLLGPQSKHHVPGSDQGQFDFHQICMLLSKLTRTLVPKSRSTVQSKFTMRSPATPTAPCSRPTLRPPTSIGQSPLTPTPRPMCESPAADLQSPVTQFVFDEHADRARHLINSLSTFRQRFVHHGVPLSAKEVLATLLTMEELWALLERRAQIHATPSCGIYTQRQRQSEQSFRLFDSVKACVRNLCAPGRMPNGLLRMDYLLVSRTQAMRVIGVLMLHGLTQHLQPLAKYLQVPGSSVSEDGDACSATAVRQTEHDETNDLNGIYVLLKSVFKAIKVVGQVEKKDTERKARFIDWMRMCGTGEMQTRLARTSNDLVKQLVTAFELLAGKNGLRNRLFHGAGGDFSVKFLQQCARKSKEILDCMGQRNHDGLLNHISLDLQLLQQKPGCAWVHLALSPTYILSKADPMFGHPNQHYIQQARPNLFGRTEDIKVIVQQMLGSVAKAVILTGDSGVGKTAVAVQIAHELCGEFCQQYWLSATTMLSLHLSLSYIGNVNATGCTSASGSQQQQDQYAAQGRAAPQGAHRAIMEARMFLSTTHGLLLIIDDILDTDMLQAILPASCLQHHVVLCTTSIEQHTPILSSYLHGAQPYKLKNLSLGDNIEYMCSLCPKLRKEQALSDATLKPGLWRFFEQQLHCSPLAVQLAAQCLRSLEGHALEEVFSQFTAQSITLTEMQEGAGSSRYHRSVLTSVHILYGRLGRQAQILLIVISFLGRAGFAVPWSILERLPYSRLATCLDLSNAGHSTHAFTEQVTDMDFAEQAKHDRQCVAILSWSEDGSSVSVPLVIQKAAIELIFGAAEGNQDKRSLFTTDLCQALIALFDQELITMYRFQGSHNDNSAQLPHVLAMLESLTRTAVGWLTDSVHVQALVRLSRGSFSHHTEWGMSRRHLTTALDLHAAVKGPQYTVSYLLLMAELGIVELKEGDVDVGRAYLEQSIQLLAEIPADTIQDQFGPFTYSKETLMGKIDHMICMAHFASGDWEDITPKVVDYISRSSEPEQIRLTDDNRLLLRLPIIGPLSDGQKSMSENLTYPDQYWHGLRQWSTGDAESGIHHMLCAVLQSQELQERRQCLPVQAMAMLLLIFKISETISDSRAFDFYATVCIDLVCHAALTSLQNMPPAPCRHKVPAKLANAEVLEKTFRERWCKFYEELFVTCFSRLSNSITFCLLLFCNMPLHEAFIATMQFLYKEGQEFMVGIANLFIKLFHWYVHPQNLPIVLTSLFEAELERGRGRWLTRHNKGGQENMDPAQFEWFGINLQSLLCNPSQGWIWNTINHLHHMYACHFTKDASEIKQGGEKIAGYLDVFEEATTLKNCLPVSSEQKVKSEVAATQIRVFDVFSRRNKKKPLFRSSSSAVCQPASAAPHHAQTVLHRNHSAADQYAGTGGDGAGTDTAQPAAAASAQSPAPLPPADSRHPAPASPTASAQTPRSPQLSIRPECPGCNACTAFKWSMRLKNTDTARHAEAIIATVHTTLLDYGIDCSWCNLRQLAMQAKTINSTLLLQDALDQLPGLSKCHSWQADVQK
eukprot:scpid30235/ scgid20704/ 